MKRIVIGLAGCLVAAGTFLAAQEAAPGQPPAAPQKAQETTLTGCLVQGSSPSVFLLDNARMNASDKSDKGKTYRLVAAAGQDLNFKTWINHEVSVTGSADQKAAPMPPAGQKARDDDQPKFEAKIVTSVADSCTTTPSQPSRAR